MKKYIFLISLDSCNNKMTQTASYILSTYNFIYTYSQDKLLDVGYQFKDGNPIPSFDESLLIDLCSEAQKIFANENNILEIEGDLFIVGDIHGSLHDLLRILNITVNNDQKVLFLGDYVDRGNFSLECITILFALKVQNPDKYFLIRGNHEFDSICSQYGFKDEILNYHNPNITKSKLSRENSNRSVCDLNESTETQEISNEYMNKYNDIGCYKYSEKLYNSFISAFSYLPICAMVNKTTFCIHGGLSPKLDKISCIEKLITRPIDRFEENQLLCDVVWSDPSSNSKSSFEENPRGCGYLFNANSIMFFLFKNSIKRIIRGHECVKKGSSSSFNGKCITVFSASSYDKNMNNCSSILKLSQQNDDVNFITFRPIDRLQKSDAIYYKVQKLNKTDGKIPTCFSLRSKNLDPNNKNKVSNKSHNFLSLQNNRSKFVKPVLRTGSLRAQALNYSLGDLKLITPNRAGFNMKSKLFT